MTLAPGVHLGVQMADYLAMPAVSASILKALLEQCSRAAWFESWLNTDKPRDDSDAADVGTIAHSMILEGGAGKVAVIDPENYPSDKGAIPKGWTNNAIRAARDAARLAGLIPVLPEDMAQVNAMVDAIRAFIASLEKTEPAIWAAFQPGGGDSESVVTWIDGQNIENTPCRIRPDRMSADRRLIVDLKTTKMSANPAQWKADHVGAAFYRRGCKAEFGTEPDYVFLIAEQHPPYLCSLVGIDPHGMEMGAEKAAFALDAWAQCVKHGVWPGYAPRVAYPEIKPWMEEEWANNKAYLYDVMFPQEKKYGM